MTAIVSDASEEDAERPRSDVLEHGFHHLFWRASRPSVATILSDAALKLFPMTSEPYDAAYHFHERRRELECSAEWARY